LTLVALVPTIEAAAGVVVSIVTVLRLSMLALMDNASINAVEDLVTMGLDRSAGALLLARSDAPGAAAAQEIEAIRAAYEANGATEAFHTDDQAEGEAFMAPGVPPSMRCSDSGRCCSKTPAADTTAAGPRARDL
jgi:glycolate oxidase